MTDSDDTPADQPPELPALAPDFIEAEHAAEIDDAIPSVGYRRVPIVGLGGSAGSIPALTGFFRNVPPATGLAYVVVLHLAPEHESVLPRILQPHTAMPVATATEGDEFQADRVYVIPPGKHLVAVDGHLRLPDMVPERGKRVAVDLFFRSLADTHGAHAIAVVLSGADGDGAIGLKRIKERGGLTIAQDPSEADHSGMPDSAIRTGMVDWILRVGEMPERIVGYVTSERLLRLPPEEGRQPATPAESSDDPSEALLREVLEFLHARTGADFSYYKRATIVRRIARRMQVNGVTDLTAYLGRLRTQPSEAGALLQDLLISVTNFFRDREAFLSLEEHIPELFRHKQPGEAVRVWCAACATGEEAYSMAILLYEYASTLAQPPALQVFGCDLDDRAIQTARAGLYPETISADVSNERLRRFFTKEPGGWRVRRELREMVLFANHDLLKDAPFSRIDLVSCRNLLIYLNRAAQTRALDLFNFALRPDGLMFLGASESVDEDSPLFSSVHKKHRLFRHRPINRVGLPMPLHAAETAIQRVIAQHDRLRQSAAWLQNRPVPVAAAVPALPAAASLPEIPSLGDGLSPSELHFKLLGRYGPASLIVDARHEILHVSANANRFLQIHEGEMTRDLLRLMHPTLRVELRAALLRAAETGLPVDLPRRHVDLADGAKAVDVRVFPAGELSPGAVLVLFEVHEPDGAVPPQPSLDTAAFEPPAVVKQLERELTRSNADLRATVEQYEVSTEELKASNEELQAMNEELRSAGEELETGREELQSVNEELTTVNAEFRNRVEELARANSDLQNLMSATRIATVFLGREFEVMRYTPAAAPLFNLIPSDVGRPIAHLHRRLDYPELQDDADHVLQTLVPIERELREDGRWFLARVQPYRTVDDHIAGVVLTFVDITERRHIEEALRESEQRFRLFVTASSDTVYRMSPDWHQMRAMDGRSFLADATDPTGNWLEDYVPPSDKAKVQEAVAKAIQGRTTFELEHRVIRIDGTIGWTFSRATPLLDERGEIVEWFGAASDVTERHLAEDLSRQAEERLRLAVEASDLATWEWDLETDRVVWNERHFRLLGMEPTTESIPAREFFRHVHPDDQARVGKDLRAAIDLLRPFSSQFRAITERSEIRWMSGYGRVVRLDANGHAAAMSGVMIDITPRRVAEDALRESRERLQLIVENAHEYAMVTSTTDRRIVTWSPGAERLYGLTAEEAIGSLTDFLFTPEDREAGVPELEVARTLEQDRVRDERWYVRKDGSRFWGSGIVAVMHDATGTGTHLLKICRDQTDEQRVKEALQTANDEAHAAAQIKDHFLALLSHELHTPLTPVVLATQVLAREPSLSPVGRQALGIIERNVELEISIVDELLDVTRIAAGKLEIVRVPTTVREAIERAIEVSSPDVKAKQQRLVVEGMEGHDALLGDPKRLQQAFWNLLKNASKFTPAAGEISVVSRRSDHHVTVEIRDSGIGFKPDTAERLFKPFEQEGADVTQKFGGLGLGLAIARANVEAHGGTIRASSAGRDRGATFTVTLPLDGPA